MVASSARSWAPWTKRYPPLVTVIVALALSILVLPSALNLPQANPGQTLEYAPVSGSNSNAPPGGNLAGLGLGSSTTGSDLGNGSGTGGGPGGPAGSLPSQTLPSRFNCVGSPPRQTEDPLSPPCVPFYQGNNGGSTWVGVTATQITVVFRFAALDNGGTCYQGTSQTNNCGPPTGYYDMDNPNDVNQFFMFRYLHDWEVYYNKSFQTYKRSLHFWAYNYGDTQGYVQNGYSTSDAASEGADNYNHLHPFAALDYAGLYSDSYTRQLAEHGVVDFGGLGFSQALATQYPALYWSYPPTLDRRAQEFASYVCTRVVQPGKVTFSGNGDTNQPRVYGLLLTDDSQDATAQQQQKLAVQYMQQYCGFKAQDTEYFHYTGNSTGPQSGWGTRNMVKMHSAGVTTIIWPGGLEYEDPKAANNQSWYPEWVMLGDGGTDGNLDMSAEPPQEMSHAWVVTPNTALNADGYPVETPCLSAILEVDPSIDRATSDIEYACGFFDDVRQLATGIQLAGPQLTPQTMDQGFHAIPPRPSTSPDEPSCYYDPGDYTCVKDAIAEWYDPTAPPAPHGGASTNGCWRMWLNGQRYLPGRWPAGDVMQGWQAGDVCNLYSGALFVIIRPQ